MNVIVKVFSDDDIKRFVDNSGMKSLDVKVPFVFQYFDKISFTDLYGNRIQCRLNKTYPRGIKSIPIDDIKEMMLCVYNPTNEQISAFIK